MAVLGVVTMGMGVGVAGFAVGGPTGVGNAEGAIEAAQSVQFFFQHSHPAHRLGDLEFTVEDGDSGGVVAPVFEALQSFEEEGPGGFVSDVSDDSTHG